MPRRHVPTPLTKKERKMPKLKLSGPPAGIKLDTNGWIRCDRCNHWIPGTEPKIVIGKLDNALKKNVLHVYHPSCFKLWEQGKTPPQSYGRY
jgi:hypothetical protein